MLSVAKNQIKPESAPLNFNGRVAHLASCNGFREMIKYNNTSTSTNHQEHLLNEISTTSSGLSSPCELLVPKD